MVGITPNIVTFVGFLGNIVAAGFFLDAAWMLGTEQADYASCMVTVGWGGFIILAAGLFDMMDGRLARMSGKSSCSSSPKWTQKMIINYLYF